MKISQAGVQLIADYEGSQGQAMADVRAAEFAVNNLVQVRLTQSEFDSLVSFASSIHLTEFAGSSLLKHLNAGNYEAVPVELKKWIRSGGQVISGLVNRRAAEALLFDTNSIA